MNCEMCHKHHAVISVGDDGEMICAKCADELIKKIERRFWLNVFAWMGLTLGIAIAITTILLLRG